MSSAAMPGGQAEQGTAGGPGFPLGLNYGSGANEKQPLTITLVLRLRERAAGLVSAGKAPSVSLVVNGALPVGRTRRGRALALLRGRAGQADKGRVARMRAHVDAQAAALGLADPEE